MRLPTRLLWTLFVAALAVCPVTTASAEVLDPLSLTKYIDALPIPGAMPQAAPNYYEIGAWEIQQQLHGELPPSTVWAYGTSQATAGYPAATIVATRNVPIDIRWTNHLPMTHLFDYAIDPTIMRAMTTTGTPITPHVHGGEQEPESDGGPHTWFTPGFAEKGKDWKKEVYHYVNTQLPATIWYHDHAFGYTRHNVYAGLAGYYIIQDPPNEPAGLPSGPYDVPLAIQDRMFTTEGQLWYPNEGETPERPVWIPEFFGDVILVNGKVWPYLNVEPRKYRFRMLNGSNARFYSLALADRITSVPGPAFHQIGTDGGYLAEPVVLNDPGELMSPRLILAPGERADVIIDFSGFPPGDELLLRNVAKAPFPNGETADPATVGQILLLKIVPLSAPDESVIPPSLAVVDRLIDPVRTRTMTLNEVMGQSGPVMATLNGLPFEAPNTESPVLGTTELWEIVNMTGDTHPIHLHLVQFQLLNRQRYNARRYEKAFGDANPHAMMPMSMNPEEMTYTPVDVTPYLKGKPKPADPNERGWKDTFRMNPGEVSRVLVRFAPQDNSPAFAFDATAEPGYVWHCHILEHEENDMMRPFHLVAPGSQAAPVALTPGAPADGAGPTTLWAPMPNPTAFGATFRFRLAATEAVALDLYSVAGQRIRSIAAGMIPAGEHAFAWNGLDESGSRVPTGVYFATLRTGGGTHTQKLIVMP